MKKKSMRGLILILCLLAVLCKPVSGMPPRQSYKELYPDGKTRVSGFLSAGQKHSTWLYYDSNGLMTQKEKWRGGKLLWQVFYYPNGRISRTVDKNGKVKERPECGC